MEHKYTIELRISGKNVDPEKITEELHVQPSLTRRAGDFRSKYSRYENGLWAYAGPQTEREWSSLEEALTFLICELQAKKDLILRFTKDFDVYWWCGHFFDAPGCETFLSTNMFGRLAAFGIPLVIDSYCHKSTD